jgi:Carboxypeptidase regulatory-like domain/TonB dependent receptor
MGRLNRVAAAVALIGLTSPAAYAQMRPGVTGVQQTARVLLGSIQGTVSDERGGPLGGAMVSALGATMAMAITDAHGRFAIDSLPPGDYIVRVHLAGFLSTRRDNVRVGTTPANIDRIELHRKDPVVGTTGTAAPADAPTLPIMAAGLELPSSDSPSAGAPDEDHPHSELAWRLRHLKRSALKDSGEVVSIADAASEQTIPEQSGSIFGRALDSAASLAASFFADPPFSGEVNLLTTSALSPGQQMFSGNFLPRGVAYLSIGAPAAGGEWAVRASMSQSDTSSWILAGSYSSRDSGNHDYGFGVSYSTQQYQVRTAQPLAFGGMNDDSRAVGALSASDRWTISPLLTVEYGGRYAHYDYLQKRSLLSPRVGATITPFENTHVTAVVAQRMLAPGAEEFLAPTIVGPWLPPERTFAPLAGEDLRVERGRFLDVGVDHEFESALVVGMRRFYQSVDDQLITLFGLPVSGGPKSPGHYYVASGGAVDADGWAVRLSTPAAQRVRASVDYSLTRARWLSRGDMAAVVVWAPEAIRPQAEDIHDVTTSVETDIPETATRVFFLYKVNTGFARGLDPTPQRLDSRFDLQVNQALPFMPFGSTRWEVLVGIRNLFRDPTDAGSVYDELLVVRPPKRVVGGVLIRF